MKNKAKKTIIVIVFFVIVVFLLLIFNKPFVDESNISCKDCNLIMIAITNVSAEHMGSYGYFRDTTPNIDAFAEEGLLFENAFAHTSWTLPSAASVFTSLYPYAHGIWDRSRSKVFTTPTLAEILKSEGFKTAAFTGGGDYNKIYGLNKGFGTYVDSDSFVYLKDRIPLAENWLEDNSKDRFFLYLQGFDTHCPFNPRAPNDTIFVENEYNINSDLNRNFCLRGFKNDYEGKDIYETYYFQQDNPDPIYLKQDDVEYLISQYDGEMRAMDSSVNTFLEYLEKNNLLENTIIIIYSEHGEMFGKNGRFGRAGANRGTLYDEVIHIPLIINHPNIKEPKRIDSLVQLIDIMPTLLEFFGIPYSGEMQGKSLIPIIFEGTDVNEYVYAGAVFGIPEFDYFNGASINETIRNKEWKLIYEIIEGDLFTETWELYNIQNDPNELNNVAASNLDIVDDLKEKLSLWRSSTVKKEDEEYGPVPADLLREAKERGYW